MPSSPEPLHELNKQLKEAQQQAKFMQEELDKLSQQSNIPNLEFVKLPRFKLAAAD